MEKKIWEGSYGSEPFDLRLTALRLLRNLHKIAAATVAGALLFGGGYYVKNICLRPQPQYAATSVYKVQYVEEPVQSGDYYINEATWNTLLTSEEFLTAVQNHLAEESETELLHWEKEQLSEAISAKLPSDWHIPTTTVVTADAGQTAMLAAAVEKAMTEELAEGAAREVLSVRILDSAVVEEVPLDVRPVRAFALGTIVAFLLSVLLFLLKELGEDSIWLPSSLRRRYGIPVLGTIQSRELRQNIEYIFAGRKEVGVVGIGKNVDTAAVVTALEQAVPDRKQWTALPSPLKEPQSCEQLRQKDGALLVVGAGSHAGKPLEYVLELLQEQDIQVTALLLWDADEVLLRMYYMLPVYDGQ